MKQIGNKSRKVTKGAPSGFLVSLLFHGIVFFIAGVFVVFKVMNPPEPEFEAPPPIERPKMKLKKPKVKVNKSSNPKPSSRIVAKVKTKQMPEIQLPDLMGTGDGLLGEGAGIGGEVLDLPDINSIRLMGTTVSSGSDFVGVYYDFNRLSDGRRSPIDTAEYQQILVNFFSKNWNTRVIDKYYHSPQKRYATCFMVPEIPSDLGPDAFGESGAAGYCWGIYYKGNLVHRAPIKFRFWGFGDDVLMVRVNGKLVLAASWPGSTVQDSCGWTSRAPESGMYRLGAREAQVGDWITLEGGVPVDMEVFIGESPGGTFCAQLLVEVDGVEYERNKQGGPILPMFTTEVPSWGTLDAIYEHLVQGEAMLTNGPVFNDFYDDKLATAEGGR